jgi:hypothetical protein
MGMGNEPAGRGGGVVGRYLVARGAKSSETRYRRRLWRPSAGSAPPTALRAAGRRSRAPRLRAPRRAPAVGWLRAAHRAPRGRAPLSRSAPSFGRRLAPRRPPRSARPGAALALRACALRAELRPSAGSAPGMSRPCSGHVVVASTGI